MSFKKIGNYKSPDVKLADLEKKEDNLFINSSVFGIKSTMTKSDLISKGIILKKYQPPIIDTHLITPQ